MPHITSRPYRLVQDHMAVYQFMLEIYQKDWRNGVPAPFLEYALHSSWMDKRFTYLNRLWFDGDKIVALVFYENPVTDVYFSLRPGYESLADEMVAHAAAFPNTDGNRQLVLFGAQTALKEAAARAGYQQVNQYWDCLYDFSTPLDYPLPAGYRFVPMGQIDVAKADECCWKGFGHEAEEGPYDGDITDALMLLNAPHQTADLAVCIEDESTGEYVCYAGMWFTPENDLAYMEPLCTVPAHQHKGLASAALSEMYRRTKPLGATHMTGGGNPFYQKIGYKPVIEWTFWKK